MYVPRTQQPMAKLVRPFEAAAIAFMASTINAGLEVRYRIMATCSRAQAAMRDSF